MPAQRKSARSVPTEGKDDCTKENTPDHGTLRGEVSVSAFMGNFLAEERTESLLTNEHCLTQSPHGDQEPFNTRVWSAVLKLHSKVEVFEMQSRGKPVIW